MDNIEEAMVGWYEKAKTLETSNAALREEVENLWRCLRVKVSPSVSRHLAIVEAEEAENLPALMKALEVDNGREGADMNEKNTPPAERGEPCCPDCGGPLKRVKYDPRTMLNRDQFDSQKAGDYWCENCRGSRAQKNSYRYFWEHELKPPTPPADLLAVVREHVRELVRDLAFHGRVSRFVKEVEDYLDTLTSPRVRVVDGVVYWRSVGSRWIRVDESIPSGTPVKVLIEEDE